MANLSQIKRERMLQFLEKIKAEHSDDESLIAISEIENELTEKKYGLVWEQHEEAVDVQMRDNVPVFTEVKEKEIKGNPDSEDYNFLLEGDNLHSLKLLEKTHKGKIDVIYIDPPYNTGNKDFKYNDAYIDKVDTYKNSKWLSFMQNRLIIARNLLSVQGVIFISIDDNEMYPLKMLCDEIFGEECFVSNIIWQKKTGASDARGLANITEYILVYVKNADSINDIFAKNNESFDISRYKFQDEYYNERGPFYYDSLDRGSVRYSDSLNYEIKAPNGDSVFPNGRSKFENDGWTWKWSKEKVEWGIENGFIDISPSNKKGNGWAVRYKIYLYVDNEGNKITKSSPYKNVINTVLNANAAADIKNMFDGYTVFQYSKPVGLIKSILSFVANSDAVVLDFFAGSGTTGQAVLEYNKEKGGDRRFILCTNNENGICEEITYARLEKTVNGYKNLKDNNIEGVNSNLKYYKTEFIPKSSDDEEYSVEEKLTEHIKEMIQLEWGTSLDDDKYVLLFTDEDADALEADNERLERCKGIYISSSVMLTSKQELAFANIPVHIIPDYYFDEELREVGEL